MILQVAKAEFRYQLRSPQAAVTFSALFGLCFLLTANAGEFQSFAPGGTVLANGPHAIAEILIKLSVAALFAIPGFMAGAVVRDRDSRFDAILFATPITKGDYLFGRFFGAFAALMAALAGAPLGLLLGTFWPWADAELLGPTHLEHYLGAYFGILLPSVFAISAIAFAVAVLSGKLMHTYVTVLALLVLYLVTGSSEAFPALLDPFLFEVFDAQTRYWTAVERNSQMIGFTGAVIWSRALWTGVAAAFLLLAYRRFSFRAPARRARVKGGARTSSAVAELLVNIDYRCSPTWGRKTRHLQFLARTRFEIWAVAQSAPFVIVMALSFFLLTVQLMNREVMYGVNAHPVTRLMLSDVGSLVITVMAILVFYGAEIIWRERTHGVHEIIDATPAPNGVFAASKLAALAFIVVSILGLAILIGAALQLLGGYHRIEWGLYFERGLVFPLLQFLCLAVLVCFFQVVARGRYLGMMLFGLFLGALVASRDLFGIEHPLASYVFPGVAAPLSDMNGTGRFMALGYWVRAYWGSIAGILLVFTYLLFERGTVQPLRYRLRRLKALGSRKYTIPLALSGVCLLASAGVIYYNTNVVNEFRTETQVEELRVAYEKKFRAFENLPMPRVVEVNLEVDLYPEQLRVEARSTHVLENKTNEELSAVHVVFPPGLEVLRVTLDGGTQTLLDEKLASYHVFDLATPMAPGDRLNLKFEVLLEIQGFPHRGPDTRLVRNGTFIANAHIAPTIGFERAYMIEDARTRELHNLPPLPRRPDLDDLAQHYNNVGRQDSDYLKFEATVSTASDQIALTLGALENEWVEADRRYFHYKAEAPVRNFYPFLSAKYAVAKDRWGDVEIEVYHHPAHTYNVSRMIEAVKDSLDFYSATFGPYPFRQLRIAELPAFRAYAQAYAGIVPFSEAMGFVADVKPGDIDMPYYVTAHEVAHMWWGHVVTAANTQGDGFIHETLAQYSALRVMEHKYGRDQIRKFLKYELDRYLAGRADYPEGELPLHRVERQQHIHYRKGALVMIALRDYLGAEVVDRSLRRLVELRAFSSTPYATSTDFLNLLKAEAGDEHLALIEDFFEKITLYDLKVADATVQERADGRFDVHISVEASKVYAASDGTEIHAAFDLPVDIGLFSKSPADEDFMSGNVILLEKKPVDEGASTITLTVDRRPTFVGIDPYNKLIDRDSQDNLRPVRSGSSPGSPIGTD